MDHSGGGEAGGEQQPRGGAVELAVDDVHKHGREDSCREQVAVGEGVGALEEL